MKLKKLAISLAVGFALTGAAVTAQATTITTTVGPFAGTYGPFGGFDWASNGLAVASNFNLLNVGDSVVTNLSYWATAANIVDPAQSASNPGLTGANAGILFGNFEYTIAAQLSETAVCTASNGVICTQANFILNSGTWNIFYDVTKDANRLTGAGYLDGVNILSGTFAAGFAGTFTATATGGTGSNTLHGTVTFTDTAYISPALLGTTAGTELKFGTDRTDDGFLPTASPFGAVRCDRAGGTICMQGDANQSFSAVPEPASLALLGIGLFGLGAIRRRKQ